VPCCRSKSWASGLLILHSEIYIEDAEMHRPISYENVLCNYRYGHEFRRKGNLRLINYGSERGKYHYAACSTAETVASVLQYTILRV
jgi:hypothetical protein